MSPSGLAARPEVDMMKNLGDEAVGVRQHKCLQKFGRS